MPAQAGLLVVTSLVSSVSYCENKPTSIGIILRIALIHPIQHLTVTYLNRLK